MTSSQDKREPVSGRCGCSRAARALDEECEHPVPVLEHDMRQARIGLAWQKRALKAEAEVEQLQDAIGIALPALEGYLRGESGLPFTDPYRAARTAAEALRAVRNA